MSLTSKMPLQVWILALPLATITAYEAFFDRLGIDRDGADAGR